MAELVVNIDVRGMRDELAEAGADVVQHLWQKRKDDCLLAAGDVLYENGFLPHGTTWEAFNNELIFNVDKGKVDLAHYFHEGVVYEPNYPIFASYETYVGKDGKEHYARDAQGRKIGIGDPIAFRSPEKKTTEGRPIATQGIDSPSGVPHWTQELSDDPILAKQYAMRCLEILTRR